MLDTQEVGGSSPLPPTTDAQVEFDLGVVRRSGIIEQVQEWDAAADAYAAQPQVDWFDAFLVRNLGDVTGKRVLDLGCGHGWFAGQLHERGAGARVLHRVDRGSGSQRARSRSYSGS